MKKTMLLLGVCLLAAPLTAQKNDVLSRWKGELPPPGVSQRFGNTPYDRYQARHPEPKLTPGEALLLVDILRPRYRDFRRVNRSAFADSGFAYHDFSNGVSGTSQRLGPFTYHDFSNGVSGTSQRLGHFTYHDFSNGVSGTSQRLGHITYHDFSGGLGLD